MCKNINEKDTHENVKELLNMSFGSKFVRICVF
jgi:hypothetical protein